MSSEQGSPEKMSYFSDPELLRMDADIATLSMVSHSLEALQTKTLVEFGYGIEALTTHVMTRFHHDGDIALVIPENVGEAAIRRLLPALLTEGTGATWYELPTANHWAWLRADDPAFPDLPQQLNIHLYVGEADTDGASVQVRGKGDTFYQIATTKGHVYDSHGTRFGFETPTMEELAAAKLRLIPAYRQKGETIRPHDVTDTLKLLTHENFNQATCERIIATYFMGVYKLSETDALHLAQQEVEAMGRLGSDEV